MSSLFLRMALLHETGKLGKQLKSLYAPIVTKLRSNMKNQLMPMAGKRLLRKRALSKPSSINSKISPSNTPVIEGQFYGPSHRRINCLLPSTQKTNPRNRSTTPTKGLLTQTHVNLTHQNAAANLSTTGACAIFRAPPQTESNAVIEVGEYKVAEPDGIETPAMLVFADQLDHNIKAVGELAGGSEHLFVHVKTHKSIDVTRKQLASGVAGFKCATLKELEMVLDAGAQEAILSYPLVQKSKVQRFAKLAQREATVSAIASAPAHVAGLGRRGARAAANSAGDDRPQRRHVPHRRPLGRGH